MGINWANVKLIFRREVRDQLRDRRTLFTIAVLPLLLYPLLGMSFLQVSQFMHERPANVWVVGSEYLPDQPQLIDGTAFHAAICSPEEVRLLQLDLTSTVPASAAASPFSDYARQRIQRGDYSVVIRFPVGFADALEQFSAQKKNGTVTTALETPALPTPELIFDAANDKSRITNTRVRRVLSTWQRAIVRQYLSERNIPPGITDPFEIKDVDVSVDMSRRAAFWSKVLPFVVFMWALTGAFYPAVDLCAGEKERGTLETLLSSPAERSEIVMGKLFTIMGFSSATAMLNLLSMAVTGTAVILMQPATFPVGPPPLAAIFWLILSLLPISALFSALALAIAAFARSTKEGQYYLMPLLLISMPLIVLPMLPAVEMNLGTSLIPITGMMLLLRALVESQFADALVYAPPVLLVTAGCCFLAIRWAVDQFNNESVLFRESERMDLRLRLRQLVRERGVTPTIAQAFACGLAILTVRFFASTAAKAPESWAEFSQLQFVTLAVFVAGPAILMAIFLTRNATATLLLRPTSVRSVAMAFLLAVAIHPLAMLISSGIMRLYPINPDVAAQVEGFSAIIASAPSVWAILALLALTPAICEELAFRGFILSGLRHMGSKWGAILLSSAFFGITHGILQQSISATMVGIVLGFLAVQAGSLLPCIAFHFTYNSLSLLLSLGYGATGAEQGWWSWMVEVEGGAISYGWPLLAVGTVLSVIILNWFRQLAHAETPEETLHKALKHQTMRVSAF